MTQEPRPSSEDFSNVKSNARTWSEELTIAGNQLVDKLKEMTHAGNVRSVKLKHDGHVLLEMPLSAAVGAGAITALLAPQIAILGAIAGVVTHSTLEVERFGEPPTAPPSKL